jgi:hypothetical protein
VTDLDLQAVKQSVLDYCLLSMQYGLNFNTQGNISVRLPGENRFLITPTDLEDDRMIADDMVVVDVDAKRGRVTVQLVDPAIVAAAQGSAPLGREVDVRVEAADVASGKVSLVVV